MIFHVKLGISHSIVVIIRTNRKVALAASADKRLSAGGNRRRRRPGRVMTRRALNSVKNGAPTSRIQSEPQIPMLRETVDVSLLIPEEIQALLQQQIRVVEARLKLLDSVEFRFERVDPSPIHARIRDRRLRSRTFSPPHQQVMAAAAAQRVVDHGDELSICDDLRLL